MAHHTHYSANTPKPAPQYLNTACISFCEEHVPFINYVLPFMYSHGCYGIKCYQIPIPRYLGVFNATIKPTNTGIFNQVLNATIEPIINQECKYAFLVERNWFEAHVTNPIELVVQNISYVPVVLEWGIDIAFYVHMIIRAWSYNNSTDICAPHFTSKLNFYVFMQRRPRRKSLSFTSMSRETSCSLFIYLFWVK